MHESRTKVGSLVHTLQSTENQMGVIGEGCGVRVVRQYEEPCGGRQKGYTLFLAILGCLGD